MQHKIHNSQKRQKRDDEMVHFAESVEALAVTVSQWKITDGAYMYFRRNCTFCTNLNISVVQKFASVLGSTYLKRYYNSFR